MTGRFLRFLAAGGASVVANWAVCAALARVMDLRVAVALAYLVGMAVAYTLNRLLVFEPSGRSVLSEVLRFSLVNLVGFVQVWLITLGLVTYVLPTAGLPLPAAALAHAFALSTLAITSFVAHSRFTYGRSEGQDLDVRGRSP